MIVYSHTSGLWQAEAIRVANSRSAEGHAHGHPLVHDKSVWIVSLTKAYSRDFLLARELQQTTGAW